MLLFSGVLGFNVNILIGPLSLEEGRNKKESFISKERTMKKLFPLSLLLVCLTTATLANIMNHQVTVAHVGGKVRWSQVALGPDCIAHVAFVEILAPDTRNQLYYVSYNGQTASTPRMINAQFDDYTQQPWITTSTRGVVAVIWAEPYVSSIFLRVFDPALHDWLPIERVSNWGQDEPSVVVEPNGNIHAFFWDSGDGSCLAKSKINGVWEREFVLSNPSTRCMKGNIALANDGTVWAVWMERECSGSAACEYKVYYRTRTSATNWSAQQVVNASGLSQELPFIAVGPDGIPWVAWGDTTEDEQSAVAVVHLDRVSNPIQFLTAWWTQHGPRTAVDVNNNCHIAIQEGGGDYGEGILYMNNVGGTWKSQTMYGAYTKSGGISADTLGNVAVSWSGWFGGNGSDVYINSLEAISPKYFSPPVNLAAIVTLAGAKKSPHVAYNLSWSANPDNNDQYLSGYKIYIKENNGNYQYLTTVSKTTFSQSFDYSDAAKKRRFAISTVNLGGAESELVEF
jgi:hypothetical protein